MAAARGLRELRRVPVPLVGGLRLLLGAAARRPAVLGLVARRVRHRHRPRQLPRRERLDALLAQQPRRTERGLRAPRRQQPGQHLHARVQLLRALPGVRLAALPVGGLLFAVDPGGVPLVLPLLPLALALLLEGRPVLGLLLALLLPLRLRPHPDQPAGTTTHTAPRPLSHTP
ncbi:hypothetical protein A8W25_17055 [Streptomyces sp. ERV7]|nr:hypothetical protein A8W25_17055 [Streptomyces sp. ERV7]